MQHNISDLQLQGQVDVHMPCIVQARPVHAFGLAFSPCYTTSQAHNTHQYLKACAETVWCLVYIPSVSTHILALLLSVAPVLPPQDPVAADKLTKIQKDLDETKVILHQTIDSVLRRGEKLDTLVDKSADLSLASQMFYKQARKTNSCCRMS